MHTAGAITYLTYSLGALACIVVAMWIARRGDERRSDRWAGVVALVLTANWCVAAASLPTGQPIVAVTQVAANLSWLFVLIRLFANDGRDEMLTMVRPAIASLAFVELLQLVLVAIGDNFVGQAAATLLVAETSSVLRMLVSIGALVLLHNLYVGAAQSSRRILRWNAAALAGLWAFTLNLNTVAYLSGSIPVELLALQGIALAIIAVPFGLGFMRQAGGLKFQPSRTVTFRSLSLLIITVYLCLMLAAAAWLDVLSTGGSRLTQVGLVVAAAALALVWLPSEKLRGWLRVTAIKHLFKHRYDYRAEWLRFNHTVGRTAQDNVSLHERAVKAMADVTDSPAGALLLCEEDGSFAVAGHWSWPHFAIPSDPIAKDLALAMERDGLILDIERARRGHAQRDHAVTMPEWMLEETRAWAAVPLRHFDRLVGIIVLARPAIHRQLDWEDVDLLGLVGQQLASYLSEQAGQEALSEAARFDEFNRRMAFVMHDIKNLSSQMTLLLKNAERHVDKPEFRQDMLVTLRNSADKLNTMLARLGRYGTATPEAPEPFDLSHVVAGLVERFETQHRLVTISNERLQVNGHRDGFEQAIAHIIQNAIDASDADSPVMIEVYSDGLSGVVQIVDSGVGMDAGFLRSGLFKPFVSSKDNGFGIGAYEARELVRAMGGRLDVESRKGLGTRFTIAVPLKSAGDIFEATRRNIPSEAA